MKLLGGLLGLIIVIVVGGFIYLSVADVHVTQTEISKPVQIQQ
jgi:type III secretory pathway component EscU